jgi:hypothetical protein
LQHLKHCSRTAIVGQMTLQAIRNLRSQHDQENDHKEPESPVIDSKDWARTMESIVEYFGSCLSVTKIPLAYVVQKEMVPEQAPVGGWPSNEAEMISHAPLVANVAAVPMVLAEHYKTNNKTVWTKLAKMCCDHDCWTFIHQHQKAKNAQLVFWSLYNHYLGAHNGDTLCAHAENKLTTTVYH